MKLLFLIGDTAVGKMTVGQELAKITPFRLFHNHMMIEPALEVFGAFRGSTIQRLREVIFQDIVKTDNYGLIFTFMWAFDQQADWDYVEHVKSIFGLPDEGIYYAELIAPQQVRLARNVTENRLKNKASKRDIEASNRRLIHDDAHHRCVSYPGEIPFPNYFRPENGDSSAEEAARIIRDHFQFQ